MVRGNVVGWLRQRHGGFQKSFFFLLRGKLATRQGGLRFEGNYVLIGMIRRSLRHWPQAGGHEGKRAERWKSQELL